MQYSIYSKKIKTEGIASAMGVGAGVGGAKEGKKC